MKKEYKKIEKSRMDKFNSLYNINYIINSCKNGFSKVLILIFNTSFFNKLLYLACKNGHIEVVKILIKYLMVNPADHCFIRYASGYGHIDVVKFLLADERVDPSTNFNFSISWANYNGYSDIVALLWKNKKVKNTLKNNNLLLFNKLIQLDLKEKINYFK